jgi:hypothetical protein
MTDAPLASPIDELRRDDFEVVRPFLTRMTDLAQLLDAGTRVSPELISDGVDLWKAYLHEVRDSRLEMLRSAKSLACGPGLDDAIDDHGHSQQRMTQLSELVKSYRAGRPHSETALAVALRAGALVDRSWVGFEETHPFSCLADQLTHEELRALRSQFQANQETDSTLTDRIHAYLSRPIEHAPDGLEIRCNVASCTQRTRAGVAGDPATGLELRPLSEGWVLRAKTSEGLRATEPGLLGFFCPAHGGVRLNSATARPN